MDSKNIIKILAVAAGAYLLYDWLQKNGYWAQWFGTSSAVLPAAPAISPTQVKAVAAIPAPPAEASLPLGLINALIQTGGGTGTTLYNVWQWNAVMNQYKLGSANLETADNSQTMTAAQYVAARQAKGLGNVRISYPSAYPRLAGMHSPWGIQ